MTYIDLNPIRVTMAQTPEESDYTSIQERIKPVFDIKQAIQNNGDVRSCHPERFNVKPFSPFDGSIKGDTQTSIPFSFKDYLILIDTTGRIQRKGKRGFIPATFQPILPRLNIQPSEWLNNTQNFEKNYRTKLARKRHKAL